MSKIFGVYKIIGMISNSLFLGFVLYASLIYNKKFHAKKNHYLAVFMVINMTIYYLFMLFCAYLFFREGEISDSFLCLFFIISPYLIGIFGNNYDNAKWYFSIQLFILLFSLVFVAIAL